MFTANFPRYLSILNPDPHHQNTVHNAFRTYRHKEKLPVFDIFIRIKESVLINSHMIGDICQIMIKCFDLFFFCQNRSRKRILYARNHPQFQTAGTINLNLCNRCVKFSGRKPEISHAVCHRHIFINSTPCRRCGCPPITASAPAFTQRSAISV